MCYCLLRLSCYIFIEDNIKDEMGEGGGCITKLRIDFLLVMFCCIFKERSGQGLKINYAIRESKEIF